MFITIVRGFPGVNLVTLLLFIVKKNIYIYKYGHTAWACVFEKQASTVHKTCVGSSLDSFLYRFCHDRFVTSPCRRCDLWVSQSKLETL